MDAEINSTSVQHDATSMEYMKFYAHVIDKEMQRFNLDYTVYQSFVAELPGVLDVNFDIAYNRCAFMFKYTLCNMYFFKNCMEKFILEYPEFKNLVSKWTSDPNIRLCSLSCGPGLDYLSFMLSLSDHFTLPSFKSVAILSKHGAWRNTVGIVADTLEEGVLSNCGIGKQVNFKNSEVVQMNLLISIPLKGLEALQHSSVILMVKTLNFTGPGTNEEEIVKSKLLDLISVLKPETTIFFIDTKPSLALFLEVLSKFDGKFLFQPEHLSFRVPVTFSEEYKEKHGCSPVSCSRGAFFVWQKSSAFEPDCNFKISPINPPLDIKEISQNSLEKLSNENEVSNITKTLKDIILPSHKNLLPISVGNVLRISDSNKILQPSVSNISEGVPAKCSFVNIPIQLDKSAPSQNFVTSKSVQELPQVDFDVKSCPSPFLKKSSSIDNSLFPVSSKSMLFLGESDLRPNSLHSSTIEETYPTSIPQHNVAKKQKNNEPKSYQASSESKATQTELHQSISNSRLVKSLTERVKQLVSSLEAEVQKKNSDGQVGYHLHESPSRIANYSSCSTSCSNESDSDIKPQSCNGYQIERGNPISCCNYVQMNPVHCCAVRHNMMHRCEMHCCQSCVHRCYINPHRPICDSNTASTSASLVQPQIVIPLQNVSNDILLQIIAAAKTDTKPKY